MTIGDLSRRTGVPVKTLRKYEDMGLICTAGRSPGNYRLFDEDVRVNVVRSRLVRTESLRATFGAAFEPFAERFNMERQFIPAEEVANVVLALCSGLLDGVNGQVIMVDRGTTFFDNLMRLYDEHGGPQRTWGAPIWPPIPPSVRSVAAKP